MTAANTIDFGSKMQADVREFQAAMGIKPCSFPMPAKRAGLRAALIVEETAEVTKALFLTSKRADAIVEVADGLADLAYVTVGVFADISATYDINARRAGERVAHPASIIYANRVSPMALRTRVRDLLGAMMGDNQTALCQQVFSVVRHVVNTAADLGIPFDLVWNEVHATNMAKVGGPKCPDTGKQLKPAGWQPPRVEEILRDHGFKF